MKRNLEVPLEEINEACKVFYRKIELKKLAYENETIKRQRRILQEACDNGYIISKCKICGLYGINNVDLGGTKKFACNTWCEVHMQTPDTHLLGCSDLCTQKYGASCDQCGQFSCDDALNSCVDCGLLTCDDCMGIYSEKKEICKSCTSSCIFCFKLYRTKDNFLKKTKIFGCKDCCNIHFKA